MVVTAAGVKRELFALRKSGIVTVVTRIKDINGEYTAFSVLYFFIKKESVVVFSERKFFLTRFLLLSFSSVFFFIFHYNGAKIACL